MAKTKTERITGIEEQIKQLEAQKKQLIQKQKKEERSARTKRLCSRHGLLESMLPEIITITDEQYKAFLERAVTNDYGRGILSKIIARGAGSSTPKAPAGAEQATEQPHVKPTGATPQIPAAPTAKSAETAQVNSTSASVSEGNGA